MIGSNLSRADEPVSVAGKLVRFELRTAVFTPDSALLEQLKAVLAGLVLVRRRKALYAQLVMLLVRRNFRLENYESEVPEFVRQCIGSSRFRDRSGLAGTAETIIGATLSREHDPKLRPTRRTSQAQLELTWCLLRSSDHNEASLSELVAEAERRTFLAWHNHRLLSGDASRQYDAFMRASIGYGQPSTRIGRLLLAAAINDSLGIRQYADGDDPGFALTDATFSLLVQKRFPDQPSLKASDALAHRVEARAHSQMIAIRSSRHDIASFLESYADRSVGTRQVLVDADLIKTLLIREIVHDLGMLRRETAELIVRAETMRLA